MAVLLNPYLKFRDGAHDALAFYHGVFGGELEMTTFAEAGLGLPEDAHKVMHGMVRTDTVALMVSDIPTEMLPAPDSPSGGEPAVGTAADVSISLSGDDVVALRRYWEGLSASGEVTVPLGPAPWRGDFGMCTDRFGVSWLVAIDTED